MSARILSSLFLTGLLALVSACSAENPPDEQGQETPADQSDPLAALEIQTAQAVLAEGIPLGTVPGTITVPPEARVAVTPPFAGAAMRVFVIEGEAVRRGQALAVVRAAEPVQFRGELARAQAELGLARARADRLGQLADEGIIARARAQEAQAQLAQAQASVAENRRLISLAGAGADGTMTLTAPISGRVQHVGVETGGPVDGMSAPFVIENTSAYRVDLQLPERLARSVTPGMSVEIKLPMAGGEPIPVGGTILSVAPAIDPITRSVMAKATIGAAPGLVSGQNVMVTISGPNRASGIAIPTQAVTRIDGQDHVFIRSGQQFTARKITLVSEAGGNAIVAEGLKAGDVVAISSIAELKAMTAE